MLRSIGVPSGKSSDWFLVIVLRTDSSGKLKVLVKIVKRQSGKAMRLGEESATCYKLLTLSQAGHFVYFIPARSDAIDYR
jgi:hypothetical protein